MSQGDPRPQALQIAFLMSIILNDCFILQWVQKIIQINV